MYKETSIWHLVGSGDGKASPAPWSLVGEGLSVPIAGPTTRSCLTALRAAAEREDVGPTSRTCRSDESHFQEASVWQHASHAYWRAPW